MVLYLLKCDCYIDVFCLFWFILCEDFQYCKFVFIVYLEIKIDLYIYVKIFFKNVMKDKIK